MLTELIRKIHARLAPLKSASYSCGKCGLKVEVTDHPDRIAPLIDIAIGHNCKPKPKPKVL